jgi:dTDP-N-acetylfucosamine:lipid II N-acetylfucosaminyltransferase
MIVHIVPDDKFIDMACRELEAVAPGRHRFVALGDLRPLRYVKATPVEFLALPEARALLHSDACAAICYHSLDGGLALIGDLPAGKKALWLGWGYDYYRRLLSGAYPGGLLLPITSELVKTKPKPEPGVRALGALGLSLARRLLGVSVGFDPGLLARFTHFSPVIEPEYRMARELNPWFRPEYVAWNYGTVEDDMSAGLEVVGASGDDILVGNSATAENNHAEVFDLIGAAADLADRKIIVPLSYGDEWYKEKIIDIGRRKLGGRFVPLTDFLPKEEYIPLLRSCGHVFMNHLRQQALGTICIMMLQGSRIYLNPRNPLYRWFSSKGAAVSSVQELADNPIERRGRLRPLAEDLRQQNIDVVKNHWGREIQREKTRRLVETLLRGEPT